MFTGLVEFLGTVRHVEGQGAGRQLVVVAGTLASEAALGDSVAVNGACLTIVERACATLRFEVGPETLLRTNLGELKSGDRVNLERSLASRRIDWAATWCRVTWMAWAPWPIVVLKVSG